MLKPYKNDPVEIILESIVDYRNILAIRIGGGVSCERTNYALLCVDSYYSVISYYVHAVVGVWLLACLVFSTM